MDKTNRCSIIAYSSKRSRRVVRSTTAGEGLAFADGFDCAFAIREDLHCTIGRRIPIIMLTDSEILFNIITRRRLTTERRMMVDLKSIRDAYENREIANVALVASEHNPADALAKIKSNSSLRQLMDTARISHPIRQFVIEPSLSGTGSETVKQERLQTSEKKGCDNATRVSFSRSFNE